MKESTVLLTGASGFLGSHIADALNARGVRTRALVRNTSDVRYLATLRNVELVYGALSDRSSLEAALDGVDYVIHSAGVVKARDAAEFNRVNAAGTESLVSAVERTTPNLKRLVLVSSLAVAGPSQDGRPVAMNAVPAPVTEYGRSKLGGEKAVLARKDKVPSVILRPAAIYGPRDTEVLAFFKAVKLGILPITGSRTQGVSMIFGADCAAACLRALEADVPSGRIYCVEDGQTLALGELVEHLEAAMHKRVWVRVPIPTALLYGAALGSELAGRVLGRAMMLTRDKCNELLAPHWVCDASETRRDLKWEPKVDFDTGARLTAEWYRLNGWL